MRAEEGAMGGVAMVVGVLTLGLASAAHATNVVPNPGFENCDVQSKPVGWTAVGGETVACGTANPFAGNSYMSVTNASGLAQVQSACVTIPPGATVDPFRFAYRASVSTVTQVALTATLFTGFGCTGDSSSDAIGAGVDFGGGLSTDAAWHVVTGTADDVGDDTRSVRFVVSFRVNPTSPLVVHFDAVSYDAEPPPTTTTTTVATTTTIGPPTTTVQTTTTSTTMNTTTTLAVPLAARFTVSPNPTCTGTPTIFDAAASTSPTTIVRYRFTYAQTVGSAGSSSDVEVVLADGAEPVVTHAFDWNRVETDSCDATLPPFSRVPRATRDDLLVTLTITNATGDEATTSEMVTFAVGDSCSDRSICSGEGTFDADAAFVVPRVPVGTGFPRVVVSRRKAIAEVRVPVACVLVGGCVGRVAIEPPRKRSGAAGALIAEGDFAIGRPSTAEVPVPLTEAGKKLFRHKSAVKATMTVVATGPSGAPYTSALTIKVKKAPQRR
jgi:hypothetical protein